MLDTDDKGNPQTEYEMHKVSTYSCNLDLLHSFLQRLEYSADTWSSSAYHN